MNTSGTHPTLHGHSVMLKNFSYLLVSTTANIQIQTVSFKNGCKLAVNWRMSRNTITIVNTILWINAYFLLSCHRKMWCYHIFSITRGVSLSKNHYEHSSLQMYQQTVWLKAYRTRSVLKYADAGLAIWGARSRSRSIALLLLLLGERFFAHLAVGFF